MKWMDRFDLFLLDFDGLLVNTEKLHYEAYRALCRHRGFELSWSFDRYCAIAHLSSGGLKKAIFDELPGLAKVEPSWDVLYSEKKSHYLNLLKGESLELMAGAETFLKELSCSGRKRCVVTNSTKEQIEEIKRRIPVLSSIPVWITREQYVAAKPAPDSYLKAIELLREPGDQLIGFEDTLKGVKALQAAGIFSVLICANSHPQLEESVSKSVTHFESLGAIDSQWRAR